jgi:ABC-type multidrug transport system fused ATPase/permease subunit
VIIFDEATSALDGETEAQITDVLNKLRGEKTLIIVAHRLSTIRDCDKIFFMSGGKIVDSGKFSELQKNCDGFSHLIDLAQLSPTGKID